MTRSGRRTSDYHVSACASSGPYRKIKIRNTDIMMMLALVDSEGALHQPLGMNDRNTLIRAVSNYNNALLNYIPHPLGSPHPRQCPDEDLTLLLVPTPGAIDIVQFIAPEIAF